MGHVEGPRERLPFELLPKVGVEVEVLLGRDDVRGVARALDFGVGLIGNALALLREQRLEHVPKHAPVGPAVEANRELKLVGGRELPQQSVRAHAVNLAALGDRTRLFHATLAAVADRRAELVHAKRPLPAAVRANPSSSPDSSSSSSSSPSAPAISSIMSAPVSALLGRLLMMQSANDAYNDNTTQRAFSTFLAPLVLVPSERLSLGPADGIALESARVPRLFAER